MLRQSRKRRTSSWLFCRKVNCCTRFERLWPFCKNSRIESALSTTTSKDDDDRRVVLWCVVGFGKRVFVTDVCLSCVRGAPQEKSFVFETIKWMVCLCIKYCQAGRQRYLWRCDNRATKKNAISSARTYYCKTTIVYYCLCDVLLVSSWSFAWHDKTTNCIFFEKIHQFLAQKDSSCNSQ